MAIKNLVAWSEVVRKRDNYTCQICNFYGRDVVAHHIKAREDASDLIFSIDNGQTLCRCCHIRIHSEQKASVCCFPREYSNIEGRLTWTPIIPDGLKDKYQDYLVRETVDVLQ